MAKRLATTYVKTHIRLTEAEMIEFVHVFETSGIHIQVKVYDNGNHEVVLENGQGSDVTLNFEYQHGVYEFNGSCTFYQIAPANAMRKAIATFKGSAVAQRYYANFMMEYRYEHGVVVLITERRPEGYEKIVYTYQNQIMNLQTIYDRTDIEANIHQIKEEINQLLDQRRLVDRTRIPELDAKLTDLSRRLFALEA